MGRPPEDAEVRKQIDAFMESSGGLREYDRFVLSLCDSWLAQARAIEAADDLLRRLSEWDMLYVSPEGKPVTGDGPYWQAEIARCRAALAAGGETETPEEEDAWQLTYERIDFAPIWSRADFERRARAEGWTPDETSNRS